MYSRALCNHYNSFLAVYEFLFIYYWFCQQQQNNFYVSLFMVSECVCLKYAHSVCVWLFDFFFSRSYNFSFLIFRIQFLVSVLTYSLLYAIYFILCDCVVIIRDFHFILCLFMCTYHADI